MPVAKGELQCVILGMAVEVFDDNGNATSMHPAFNPHPIQGWSPDFLSKLTHDAQVEGLIDDVVPVSSAESLKVARELARKEGIFCGISGGATFAGAIQVAQNAPFGHDGHHL